MTIKISGGDQVTLDPAIQHVEVLTNARVKRTDMVGTLFTTQWIAITVRGKKKSHILQLTSRQKNRSGKYSEEKYAASTGTEKQFSTDQTMRWYIDSGNSKCPYYDCDEEEYKTGSRTERGGNVLRDKGVVTIVDKPDKKDPTDTGQPLPGDWNLFEAYDFCIRDGGLVGVVHWSIARTTKRKIQTNLPSRLWKKIKRNATTS
jgi:hypothetical protein